MELEPDRPQFLTWAGRVALNLDLKDTGIEYIRRAWELDPGNPRVVHHAILSVDRGKWARTQDEADPGPGFEAMEVRGAQSPGGFYLVWAPGTSPQTSEAAATSAWSATTA